MFMMNKRGVELGMKILKKYAAAAAALSLSMLTGMSAAYAEGSKEMTSIPAGDESVISEENETEAYRPYLEWRDRTEFGMPSENVIYAYANAGETIFFGSNVVRASDRSIRAVVEAEVGFKSSTLRNDIKDCGASIAVTLPESDGSSSAFNPTGKGIESFALGTDLREDADRSKVYLFKVTENGKGHISDRTKEQLGPNCVGETSQNGYEPLNFVAPYTGTYSFRFLSSEYDTSDLPKTVPEISEENKKEVVIDFSGFKVNDDYKKNQSYSISELENIQIVNSKKRGHSVKALKTEMTIAGHKYSAGKKYLSSNQYGNQNENYISFTPTHDNSELEIIWKGGTLAKRNICIVQGEHTGTIYCGGSQQEYDTYISNIGNYKLEKGKEVKIYTDQREDTEIYEIRYIYDKSKGAENEKWERLSRKIDSEWAESPSLVAAWDVTVAKKYNDTYTAQNGRVWSDIFFLNAGEYKKSIYSQMNVLTQDGFLYKLKLNGIQPYGFLLYSNNRGFLFDNYSLYVDLQNADELKPLEHSFYSKGKNDVGTPPVRTELDSNGNPITLEGKTVKSTILENYSPSDTQRDFTHKMFLNEPDDDAVKAYTSSGLITQEKIDEASKSVLNDLTYVGKGNYSDNSNENIHYGTMGVGGEFRVKLTDENKQALNTLGAKNISVTLDFSEYLLDSNNNPVTEKDTDGIYKWKKGTNDDTSITEAMKNNVVNLTATVVDNQDEYTLSWNGKDAYGNNVPAGEYGNNIKSYVQMGAAHFPILDAEHNPNGIKIKMVNAVGYEGDRDKVYYNNQAKSPKDNANDTTAWYFANQQKVELYPSRIGDGLNRLSGVSSNFDGTEEGAMQFGEYESIDDKCRDTLKSEWGYGNYAALDIWAKYEITQDKKLVIGVKAPETVNAYLSFVAENGDITPSSTDTPFNKSHLKYAGSLIKEDSSVRGESEIYGNTISTGFRTNIKIDSSAADKYINWEVTIPNPSNTENNKLGESYIKIPEGTNESDSVLEAAELYNSLFGVFEEEEKPDVDNFADDEAGDKISSTVSDVTDNAVDMGNNTDDEITSFGDKQVQFLLESEENNSSDNTKENYLEKFSYDANNPVITDSDGTAYNKGKIYKFNGFSGQSTNNLKIKLSQKIDTLITASEGTTFDISVGLVIDNLYAPNATAAASYGDSTVDEVLNAIGASSYQNYLSNEDTIGYNPASNKNYQN